MITRWAGPTSAFSPNAGQCALLADARLVLPPNLDRLVLLGLCNGSGDQVGDVFFASLGQRRLALGVGVARKAAESRDDATSRRPNVQP